MRTSAPATARRPSTAPRPPASQGDSAAARRTVRGKLQAPAQLARVSWSCPCSASRAAAATRRRPSVSSHWRNAVGQLVWDEALRRRHVDAVSVHPQQQPLATPVHRAAEREAAPRLRVQSFGAQVRAANAEVVAAEPGLQLALRVRQVPAIGEHVRKGDGHVLGGQIELQAAPEAQQIAGAPRTSGTPLNASRPARPGAWRRRPAARRTRTWARTLLARPRICSASAIPFSRADPGQRFGDEPIGPAEIELGQPQRRSAVDAHARCPEVATPRRRAARATPTRRHAAARRGRAPRRLSEVASDTGPACRTAPPAAPGDRRSALAALPGQIELGQRRGDMPSSDCGSRKPRADHTPDRRAQRPHAVPGLQVGHQHAYVGAVLGFVVSTTRCRCCRRD
jgi:hypothetical protein